MVNTFISIVEKISQKAYGDKNYSPSELIGLWEEFIVECSEGYSWDVSEYHNELSVRETIEKVLEDPNAKAQPEFELFKLNVDRLDGRFRSLLQENCEAPISGYWWERGVLKYAEQELIEYYNSAYGISIKKP